jgi:hypothetical protein
MTKGAVALPFRFDAEEDEQQVPPLRYAPVGMTKGTLVLPFRFDAEEDEQQVPPLHFAPVGMTKGRTALRFRFDAAEDEQQVTSRRTAVCWAFVSHYFACWSGGRCLPSLGRGT